MKTILSKFQQLPLTNIENEEIRYRLENKKISAILVDILDGDLWGSRVSVIGNFLIIIAILFSSADFIFNFSQFSRSNLIINFKWLVGLFFLLEVALRISYAGFLGYGIGFAARLKYIFSFMGLVDILSLIPVVLELLGIPVSGGISAIRILRIWRIARFIKAFNSISKAFHSRRQEILVTLFGVLLLSLTLSAVMFHFESENGSGSFKSIPQVFIWSIGKYTGDYGAIAGEVPLTQVGKSIATINGLLGIALFAIPAGLLASAFIDQLAENRKQKLINERTTKIIQFFTRSKGGGKHLKFPGLWRYASFETLQAKLLLTDEEIFEAVRESRSLRFRAMKSQAELKLNDMRIVEFIELNTTYGTRLKSDNSKMTIINPGGDSVRGITHFVYTLAKNLKTNFFARELEILVDGKAAGYNRSAYFSADLSKNTTNLPVSFQHYLHDINSIEKKGVAIIVAVSASGRSDFVWEYGNPKEKNDWSREITTIQSAERLHSIRTILSEEFTNVNYRTAGEKVCVKSFSFEENTIGINQHDSLLRHIQKNSGCDVFVLYVNISLLTAEDETYYAALTALGNMLKKVDELYSLV